MKRGFTLIEIMIVVVIISLLAAIAIPSLLRARIQANEASAQASLKTIATAEVMYHGANNVYGSLSQLSAATPPYIDTKLGNGAKSGYNFTMTANNTTNFGVVASPQSVSTTGVRYFCINNDGVLKYNSSPIGSYSDCNSSTPLE